MTLENTTLTRRLYLQDNLEAMRSMDKASVDLIYADPPLNSIRHGAGSITANASLQDVRMLGGIGTECVDEIADSLIQSVGLVVGGAMQIYLAYMAVRLLEMRRILKPTGGIYFHCDDMTSHYIRIVMDAVFGAANFRKVITWKRLSAHSDSRRFRRDADTILFYGGREINFDAIRLATGQAPTNIWDDIRPLAVMSTERVGYPTQKPLALLERIILASTVEGDTVLDPFCGLGTTCLAAEKLERSWIGIDIAKPASSIVTDRLEKASSCHRCEDVDDKIWVNERGYTIKCRWCNSLLLKRVEDANGVLFMLRQDLERKEDLYADATFDNSPLR